MRRLCRECAHLTLSLATSAAQTSYFRSVSAWHGACFDFRMVIERAGFLLMAGTLAAGAGAGWLARDSKAHRERAEEVPAAPAAVPAPSATTVVVVQPAPPPAPVCDDSVGTPGDCPAVGPSDEGVCSNVAAKRCAEFKSTFKPKVAAAAVSCLRQLKANELCDPARVNLCGHSALMAACPDLPPATNANAAANSGVAEPSSPVTLACENILKGCANQALGPTLADCRQTLSGMSDFGRASMITCLQTHCGDKGLLGCEGVKSP
jgi:hypothetical protein